MKIEAVLFDMDGLMVDTESLSTKALISSAKKQDYEMTKEETLQVLGFTEAAIYKFWENYFEDSHVDGKKLADDHYDYIEEVLFTTGPDKMPNVEELLVYLKENNYKVAVASSSNIDHIENNMEKTGLRKYIDKIASGQEVSNGKPAPDVKPEHGLVLEDSKSGIKAGRASGATVFMIPDMFKPDEECLEIANRILKNLGEVISILEEENDKDFNR